MVWTIWRPFIVGELFEDGGEVGMVVEERAEAKASSIML